jgi:very-short-patch-repair endonuclease
MPDDIFNQEILRKGVSALSRELNCSQSTIRERAWKAGIELKCGPRPAMTETTTYRARVLKQRMGQTFPTHSTSIEVAIWAELEQRRIPFEKHKTVLNLTQPDAFIEPNICIYADGDYWHNLPKNKNQDKYVNEGLKRANYTVFRFWEHEINKDIKSCVDQIEKNN